MADYDFPADVLELRRTLDWSDADLVRLHSEYRDRPHDEGYRRQVEERRARSREAAVALIAHPWFATAEDGPAAARMALQKRVAEERAGAEAG